MNHYVGDVGSTSSQSRMSVRARQIALAFDRRRKAIIYKASGSKRGRLRLTSVEPDNEKLMRSEELDEELLPGIGNEITLIHIIPKLPWKTLLVLPSVCRDWKRALRSDHRHYHQRVRSSSTETLAVVDVTISEDHSRAIALYSVKDERFYYVPPVPGFPTTYECVAMSGKLYLLCGIFNNFYGKFPVSKEVYVLDLLGERRWRQCESMREIRSGCAVMDEKIYVFGGNVRDVFEDNVRVKAFAGTEVYDPTLDSWSPIPYPGVCRFCHRVTVVGEDLVLHGGLHFETYNGLTDFTHPNETSFLEFYNPVTMDYRVADAATLSSHFEGTDIVSGTQGIFYSIRWRDMCAHAVDEHGTHARTNLRSFSSNDVLPLHGPVIAGNEASVDPVAVDNDKPFTVTVVDDELLAVVHWVTMEAGMEGSCFVRSRGFSTEDSQLSWEKAPYSGQHSSPVINGIICSIEL